MVDVALDEVVQLRMHIGDRPKLGRAHLRGNLLARVTLGAAVAFVEGQPATERWRFVAELGNRTITEPDMAAIWTTDEFRRWVADHD